MWIPALTAKNLTVFAWPFVFAVPLFQKLCQITTMNKVFLGMRNALQPLISDPAENRIRGNAVQLCDFINGIGIIPPYWLQRISVFLGHLSGLRHFASFPLREVPASSSIRSNAVLGTKSRLPILMTGICPVLAAS